MLVSTEALRFGDFTLASGKKSPYYIDIKKAITRPAILRAIAAGIAPFASRVDRIAGVELGAVPIAVAVAMETGKPYIMERKEHGIAKDFEGDLETGDRVLFVEDVVTTGGTLVRAIDRIRGHGADVSEVVAVVDREEGGKEALAAIRVTLTALLSGSEVLRAAKSSAP